METLGVVIVGADNGQLEHDHPVVVDAWQIPARADEDEGSGEVELVESGLGGAGVSGALERHREGLVDGTAERRSRELVRRDDRGRTDGCRPGPARGGGFGHGDVGHTARQKDGHGEEADGPGPGDEDAVVGRHLGQVDGVDGDGRRLGECGGPGGQGVGEPHELVGARHEIPAEGATEREVVRGLSCEADRRAAPSTGTARAATGRGVRHHPGTRLPARHGGTARHHRARPFVSQDGPRARVAFEYEVQVAAADPALGHLDEHLVRAGDGDGPILDGDPAVADEDGGRHQLGGHPMIVERRHGLRPRRRPRARVRRVVR